MLHYLPCTWIGLLNLKQANLVRILRETDPVVFPGCAGKLRTDPNPGTATPRKPMRITSPRCLYMPSKSVHVFLHAVAATPPTSPRLYVPALSSLLVDSHEEDVVLA